MERIPNFPALNTSGGVNNTSASVSPNFYNFGEIALPDLQRLLALGLARIDPIPRISSGARDFTHTLKEWQNTYNLPQWLVKTLLQLEQLTKDNHWIRPVAISLDDFAEASHESIGHYFGESAGKLSRLALWGTSIAYFMVRAGISGLKDKAVTEALVRIMHDASTSLSSAAVVNIFNRLQNLLVKVKLVPESIMHLIRPISSFILNLLTINKIDKPIGDFLEKRISKPFINSAFGKSLNAKASKLCSSIAKQSQKFATT